MKPMRGLGFKIEAARLRSVFTPHITRKINGPVVLALLHQPDLAVLPVDLRPRQSHDLLDAQRRGQSEALDDRKPGAGRLVEADSTSPAQLVIRRSKLARGAVDGAVRHPAIDRLVVVVAVEDEAIAAPGDDVENIGRPDLEVLRASEAKNCDLLIEIGGRMDEVCESCHKVF
jgi:hypothetical protein